MRRNFLLIALSGATLLALSTELLSLFTALNRIGVGAFWACVLGFCGWLFFRKGSRKGAKTPSSFFLCAFVPLREKILESPSNVNKSFPAWLLSLWLLMLFVVAMAAPPNTYDSMTYHMGRVANWLQFESVAHYVTHVDRQLTYPPFAEFAIAHLQLLTGGDRLANLVQFGSLLGCLVGISLIARKLGAGGQGEWLTAVLVVTLPMVILQATSTQNDLVVAFWLVCLIYFVLENASTPVIPNESSRRNLSGDSYLQGFSLAKWRFRVTRVQVLSYFEQVFPTLASRNDIMIGLSLGLACLTKFTGYIYGAPIIAWYTWRLWENEKNVQRVIQPLLLVAALALLLNIGHFSRTLSLLQSANWQLAAQIAPNDKPRQLAKAVQQDDEEPESEHNGRFYIPVPSRYINQYYDPQAIISNTVRNIGLHLGTPFPAVNSKIDAIIFAIHNALGVRIDDPVTTYPYNAYHKVFLSQHEDEAGNLVHMLLLLLLPVSLLALSFPRRRESTPTIASKPDLDEDNKHLLWQYGIVVFLCASAFVVALRWQPWHSRLHVPLFVLAMPLLAIVLERFFIWEGQNGSRKGAKTQRFHLLGVVTPLSANNTLFNLFGLLFFASALPWLLYNVPRPLLGDQSVLTTSRTAQYFANQQGREVYYQQLASEILANGCEDVGLFIGGNDWEYPLWVFLGKHAGQQQNPIKLRHVEPNNNSRFLAINPAQPTCLVATKHSDAILQIHGRFYQRHLALDNGRLNLYLP